MKLLHYHSFWKTIGVTVLIAGIGDLILPMCMITYYSGKFPDQMLYYMAGGILGLETSMKGGYHIGLVGLLTHFFITFCFTISMFAAVKYLKLYKLKNYTVILFAVVYSFVVNIFMNRVALQYTRLPPQEPTDYSLSSTWVGHFFFTVLFTLPIVYFAYRYYILKEERVN